MTLFLILQIGGQLSAGRAGAEGGFFSLFTVISYIFLISRGLIWVLILKRVELVAAYPFTGIIYLLILPLSVFFFSDELSWEQVAGAGLIFIGIIFTAVGQTSTRKRKSR